MTWRHMESTETAQHIILMHVPCIFILFLLQPTNAQIYITYFLFK